MQTITSAWGWKQVQIAQVTQARNVRISSVTIRNLRNIRICLGEIAIASVIYENGTI